MNKSFWNGILISLLLVHTFSSMTICNHTKYKLYVTLDQVGTLYWDILSSGDCMHRNTGAVHFTVTANIATDDFVPPTDFQTVMQHLKWIGVGASAVATVGTAGVFSGLWAAGLKTATTATGIFGGVASTVGEMLKYPRGYYELSVPGWYAGKDHILSIYHSKQIMKIYSYRNDDCWPQGCWQQTKRRQRNWLEGKRGYIEAQGVDL